MVNHGKMKLSLSSFFVFSFFLLFGNTLVRPNDTLDSKRDGYISESFQSTRKENIDARNSALAVINGEFKRYHKLSLTWDAGMDFSETDITFQDYRLNVTFTSPSGKTYRVPGFFAADGDAKETSSISGSKWRCNFLPLESGTWSYTASFRNGTMIAASFDSLAGVGVAPIDGDSGSFSIINTDKSGIDLRAKGKLEYVGEHFMRWTNGEYFMKIGSDSPEVLLEYNDIDDYDGINFPRTYANHVSDWNTGDPTWQGDKGKGLIGVINYLSGKGVNSQYFVLHRQYERGSPFSNVPNSYYSYDISRLSQWEVVFDHMVEKGMHVHLVFSESTNQSFFETDVPSGDPLFSDARKIYFREMVARFGYLNAVTWNIGEENGWDRRYLEWTGDEAKALTTQQQLDFTSYIDDLAYYNDHITVHNGHANDTGIYDVLQGNNSITGTSMQGVLNDNNRSKFSTQQYREESAASGKKWVVYYDEAWFRNDYDLANFRRNVLWSALTAGSAGIEHYGTDGLDVTMEDLRFYDTYYEQMKYAYDFYHDNNIPFYQMYNQDELIENGWVHGTDGDDYVIYVEKNNAGTTTMRLLGDFQIKWFDPRAGGGLLDGSITNVSAGENVNIGLPPYDTDLDWVALVRTDPDSDPIQVTEIVVEPTNVELGVGSTYDLRAQVLPSNADNLNVNWSSSDSSIVSVDNQGNIVAVGVGLANIIVTTVDGGRTAQTVVNVVDSSDFCVASGAILMERYDGINGYEIADLLNAPNYPNNPDISTELFEFEIPRGVGNNYGTRVSGLLCAPETGVYTFWIAGDDVTELNLSTDEQRANVRTIAFNDRYTGLREWNKYPSQKSVEIELRQGQKYYIEGLMKQGSGGDHMSVAWRKPSDRSGALPEEVVPGSVLTSELTTPVTGVAVNSTQADIEVGETLQLVEQIEPVFASNTNVMWVSENNTIVTVDAYGNIEGISPGTTKIIVTTEDGGFTAETIVVVEPAQVQVSGVTVDVSSASIAVSEIFVLNAEVQPTNASNPEVIWYSSDNSVVSVDAMGTVTGISEGNAIVTVRTVDGGFEAETTLSVVDNSVVPVTGVNLNVVDASIFVAQTLQLTAEIVPADATNQNLVWTTDDASIALVDAQGNITGVGLGNTIIRVTAVDGGFSAESFVTVIEANVSVIGIAIDYPEVVINVAELLQATAEIQPSDATNQSVNWSSDDATIATVDVEGNIVGVSPGVTTIRATSVDGGYEAQTMVTVLAQDIAVSSVSINPRDFEIGLDQQLQIFAEVQPSNATNQELVWSSDDPNVVTIDSEGNVLGVSPGVATIHVTTNDGGYTDFIEVTVLAQTIAVMSITSVAEVEIGVGQQLQILAEIQPSNATNQSIVWSSDDSSIVSIDSEGNIVGVGPGTTVVRVTTDNGGYFAETIVTVIEATIAVTEIRLDYTSIDLEVGQRITLTPTIFPEDASNVVLRWSSEDTSVVTVDAAGNILGVSEGATLIRVTTSNGTLFSEIEVTVTAEQLVSIYPNPAQDFIMVSGVNELIFVSIFTSDGKILKRVKTVPGGTRIPIAQLPPAIYFIGLDSGRKMPFIKR